jgi:hypothetical protein
MHPIMSRSCYLRLLSWFIPFLLASTTVADTSSCYYPNGDTDKNYKKCLGDSLACCLEGESCFSNGLWLTANFGILYRGLCADKTWPISKCPRVCYEGMSFVIHAPVQCVTTNPLRFFRNL